MRASIFLTIAIGLLLSSCSKEESFEQPGPDGETTLPEENNPGGGSASIIGNYQFLSSHFIGGQSTEYTENGTSYKTTSYQEYLTTNNTGTLKIEATRIISTDLAYDVDGPIEIKSYIDGDLIIDDTIPLTFSAPPSSSNFLYVKVGSDSLNLPQGGTLTFGSGSSITAPPNGYKYKIQNDTLHLIAVIKQNKTTLVSGVSQRQIIDVTFTSLYKKL